MWTLGTKNGDWGRCLIVYGEHNGGGVTVNNVRVSHGESNGLGDTAKTSVTDRITKKLETIEP